MAQSALAALLGVILLPFGSLEKGLNKEDPWRVDTSKDHYVFVLRAARISGQCRDWASALVDAPIGANPTGRIKMAPKEPGALPASEWGPAFEASWLPFEEKEQKFIKECDESPCREKLDVAEANWMGHTLKERRMSMFRDIVFDRISSYLRTGERKSYERRDARIDPWAFFTSRGLKSALAFPSEPTLWARRIHARKEDDLKIRQVIDRRTSISPDGLEAVAKVRDVYTNHLFDTWGEWHQVACQENGTGVIVQAILLEVDLLKKTDLLSVIARGQIRSQTGKRGAQFLDQEYADIKVRVRPKS